MNLADTLTEQLAVQRASREVAEAAPECESQC
jgi:hypothetical protein